MSQDASELNAKRLGEAVAKTGLPLELQAIEICESAGWKVTHSPQYLSFDPAQDADVEREGDVLAHHYEWATKDDPVFFTAGEIWIECKDNRSHWWVFFNLSGTTLPLYRFLSTPLVDDLETMALRGGPLSDIFDSDAFPQPVRTVASRTIGRNYETVKNRDRDPIYDAIQQTRAQLEASRRRPRYGTLLNSPPTLSIHAGVLLVSNPPIVARRDSSQDNGFAFEATDWLIHSSGASLLHVVTPDGLRQFLELVDSYLGWCRSDKGNAMIRTAVRTAANRDGLQGRLMA